MNAKSRRIAKQVASQVAELDRRDAVAERDVAALQFDDCPGLAGFDADNKIRYQLPDGRYTNERDIAIRAWARS